MKVVAGFFLSLILGEGLGCALRITSSKSLYPSAVNTLLRQLEKLLAPDSFLQRMPRESDESTIVL